MEGYEWPDCPTEKLIEFVIGASRSKHWGGKTIDAPDCHHPLMKLWQAHAEKVIKEHCGFESDKWTLWGIILDSKSPTDDTGEWVQGLRPFGKGAHIHGWEAPALIHYLQVSEGGGELVVERDGELIEMTPKEGYGLIVGGKERHGVRKVTGNKARIGLIAAGIENKRG